MSPAAEGGPSLERLWAGWRSVFVTAAPGATSAQDSAPDSAEASGCVFCSILASGVPDEHVHILWRHPGGLAIAILNLYPYTSGHLMVMPTRHVASVEELSAVESGALWGGMTAAVRSLKAAYRPGGFNLGANVGRAGGAGVPGHFHLHVVPRWEGDTNFMTAVADTRVLPEALSDTAARLRAAWPASADRS